MTLNQIDHKIAFYQRQSDEFSAQGYPESHSARFEADWRVSQLQIERMNKLERMANPTLLDGIVERCGAWLRGLIEVKG
jgi:hypothetical protein